MTKFFLLVTLLTPDGRMLASEVGPFPSVMACEVAARSPMVTARPGQIVEMQCVARTDI